MLAIQCHQVSHRIVVIAVQVERILHATHTTIAAIAKRIYHAGLRSYAQALHAKWLAAQEPTVGRQ